MLTSVFGVVVLLGGLIFFHELGHYFGLPHTFSGWEGYDPEGTDYPWNVEYVDGSNCESAGDGFCDTPADFIGDRWSCPYDFNRVDPHGDPYYPDSSLFMSYANDNCVDRFSNEQISSMIYNLLVYRNELLDHPTPDIKNLYKTEHIYPEDFTWQQIPVCPCICNGSTEIDLGETCG